MGKIPSSELLFADTKVNTTSLSVMDGKFFLGKPQAGTEFKVVKKVMDCVIPRKSVFGSALLA
jgi:hypothetical protein